MDKENTPGGGAALAILILLAAAPTHAFAEEQGNANQTGVYFGVGGGFVQWDLSCPRGFICEDTGSAIAVFGGYTPQQNISLEFGYGYLPGLSIATANVSADIDVSLYYGAVLGRLPLGRVVPFAKLGFGKYESSVTVGGNRLEGDSSGLLFGAGADIPLGERFGLRAEVLRYEGDEGGTIATGSVFVRF